MKILKITESNPTVGSAVGAYYHGGMLYIISAAGAYPFAMAMPGELLSDDVERSPGVPMKDVYRLIAIGNDVTLAKEYARG